MNAEPVLSVVAIVAFPVLLVLLWRGRHRDYTVAECVAFLVILGNATVYAVFREDRLTMVTGGGVITVFVLDLAKAVKAKRLAARTIVIKGDGRGFVQALQDAERAAGADPSDKTPEGRAEYIRRMRLR